METKRFEIVPPGKQVLILPVFIALFVFAGLLLILSSKQATPLPWPVWIACAVMLLVVGVLAVRMLRNDVELSDEGLRVKATPWPGTTPVDELDLERAEIVDLSSRPELAPAVKLIGTRLPGYRAGIFWLRDKRRATVLLTELHRVLVLPRRDGTVVLLSLQRPEALLDALRRRRG
jgi:hypothetical protein